MSFTMLVMIDGLRPDALDKINCPHIDNIKKNGSYTMAASSIMPSITLPCHTSIFHSVPPARHGITTNDWHPMARPLPGLVDLAKAANLRSAFFTNWEPLRNLSRPGSLSFAYFRDNAYTDPFGDLVIASEAVRYIKSDQPDFAFVYMGTVDIFGHFYGWMSDEYLAQIETADNALGILLDDLPENSTILMQSDHGGHDRDHGTEMAEDMVIPWMISGPGIRPGYQISQSVSLLDTAPTLARTLGLQPHHEWEGRIVDEVFES